MAAKRLIPTSNVKLAYMVNSPQAQKTAATDEQADVLTVLLPKEAQHTDADEQPNLLKARRTEPSKAVKEPSAKPGRSGVKGNKALAGPKRAQPGVTANEPSLVPDQAQAGIDSNHALAVLQAEAGADSNKPSLVSDHAQPETAGNKLSAWPDQARAEAVGHKLPALPDQAQAGANGNPHLGLPDQVQDDSTWPVLNKRARKQLLPARYP
ncbi:hypothetical protein WJX77_009886 [Trebouxia sp. C0004]